jgi:tetratricopeptide repeat protein 21B
MSDIVLALVFYHAKAGYSRQIQTVCNEVLRKRPNDAMLKFWRAYGLLLEGSTQDVR